MNVLLVASSNVVGGHEAQLANIAESLSESGVDVDLACGSEATLSFFTSNLSNVNVFLDKDFRLLRVNVIFQLIYAFIVTAKNIRKFACYDKIVISAGAIEAAAPFVLLGRLFSNCSLYIPTINFRHGMYGTLYNPLLILTLYFYRSCITINRIQSALIKRYSRCDVAIIRNLVKNKVDSRQLISRVRPRAIFIGRLDANKRVVEALKWLDTPDSGIDEVLVFGDGPELKIIQNYSFKYINISCCGWLPFSDLVSQLSINDVFIINSISEGEPTIVREMNLLGIRVLSRDILGVRGVTKPSCRFTDQDSLLSAVRKVVGIPHSSNAAAEKTISTQHFSQIKSFFNV